MKACSKHLGPGQHDRCCRPADHEGPCKLFSPETRIEYMRAMVKEGRPHVTEAELDEMEHGFWARERETAVVEHEKNEIIKALKGELSDFEIVEFH